MNEIGRTGGRGGGWVDFRGQKESYFNNIKIKKGCDVIDTRGGGINHNEASAIVS
jgi:hypothetical protein